MPYYKKHSKYILKTELEKQGESECGGADDDDRGSGDAEGMQDALALLHVAEEQGTEASGVLGTDAPARQRTDASFSCCDEDEEDGRREQSRGDDK